MNEEEATTSTHHADARAEHDLEAELDAELLAGIDGEDDWAPSVEDWAVVDELLAEAAAERAREGPWRELPPGADLGTALAALDPATLSDYDLVEFVMAWERQRRHAEGMLATAVAALARRPVFERCAEPDELCGKQVHGPEGHDPVGAAADEIGPALTWTGRYAAGQVEGAVELAEQLPDTLAALRAGRIDGYKAKIIREHTRALEHRPGLRARVEAAALRAAAGKTAPALRALVKRAVLAADPDAVKERRKEAKASRGVSKPAATGDDEDGMAAMSLYGPIESLAALFTAVDAAARARREAAEADPDHADADKTLNHLRFDVVADLGFGGLALGHLGCCNPTCMNRRDTGAGAGAAAGSGQPLGTQQGVRAHIVVRMNAATAAGHDDLPAELEGFGLITAEAARQLAADATWRRLLTDPVSGQLLDYGRTTYQPPQALREFLIARDVTCGFPTCSWPARSSDLDHEPAWADGGETNPDGMIALHRPHHIAKTHHGHRIQRADDGTWHWTTPTRHTYKIHPTVLDTLLLLHDNGNTDPPDSRSSPDSDDPPPF